MKILVIGGNGQLGFELQRQLSVFGEVSITTRTSKCPAGHPCIRLDLGDSEEISSLLESLRPHIIVNAAAYTQVDKAQSDAARAEMINRTAVATMARKAREISALLIHFSTDYVYSGDNRLPWTERDPVMPASVYGATKLGGDQAIMESECAYWILRTQWLYGARGHNFLRTMLRLGAERIAAGNYEALKVVNDQFGAPTPVRWLAITVSSMVSRWLQEVSHPGQSRTGIYHLSAAGQCTWHDFAGEIFEQAHMLGLINALPKLEGVSTLQYGAAAPRPRYTVLSNQRIQREFDIRLPDWREGVSQTLADYKLALSIR
jgi:dTDP-4-dehydrorhamnose reductase